MTKATWQEARAKYESGTAIREIAREIGTSHEAVRKRIAAEGWVQDQEARIRRETAAKVAGLVGPANQTRITELVAEESERRAEIVRMHRDEPKAIRGLIYDAAKALKAAETGEAVKLAELRVRAAKGLAQAMAALHQVERDAWGLSPLPEGPGAQAGASLQVVIEYAEEPGAIEHDPD